jgi:hypothetical protein
MRDVQVVLRTLAIGVVAAALGVAAGACSDAAGVPAGCSGGLQAAGAGPAPRAGAAAALVTRYLHAVAAGRPAGGLQQAVNPAGACSLRWLDGWLRGVPIARLTVIAVPIGGASAGTVDVLATLSARLGRPPGTVAISLGQRVLEVAGRDHPRIAADVTSVRGSRPSGLAAIPHATYQVSGSGVVVSDGATHADARLALAALDGSYMTMARRYGALALPHPIVALLPSRLAAEHLVGYPISPWEAGMEIQGLVLMIGPEWCCGGYRQGIVVHELAHAATRRMVIGTPVSMVEGVARYEEENWDSAHGLPLPDFPLADAYRAGWDGASAWQWEFQEWYRVSQSALRLRYADGAAVVREVVREAGVRGLRALTRAFRAHRGVTWLTRAQLNAVFKAGTGRTFTQIEAAAQRAAVSSS